MKIFIVISVLIATSYWQPVESQCTGAKLTQAIFARIIGDLQGIANTMGENIALFIQGATEQYSFLLTEINDTIAAELGQPCYAAGNAISASYSAEISSANTTLNNFLYSTVPQAIQTAIDSWMTVYINPVENDVQTWQTKVANNANALNCVKKQVVTIQGISNSLFQQIQAQINNCVAQLVLNIGPLADQFTTYVNSVPTDIAASCGSNQACIVAYLNNNFGAITNQLYTFINSAMDNVYNNCLNPLNSNGGTIVSNSYNMYQSTQAVINACLGL